LQVYLQASILYGLFLDAKLEEVSKGSLLSVRGLGLAKLLEVGGLSRKGRNFIKIGIYGR